MRDGPAMVEGGGGGLRRLRENFLEDAGGEPLPLAGWRAEPAQWPHGPRSSYAVPIAIAEPSAARVAGDTKRSGRIDVAKVERVLDLRRLRYFVQIVAEGSFSHAAQSVRVAQPALSHHVRELEAVLGVSLLKRSPHGVVPTEAGQCLYEHGVMILGRVRDAAVEMCEFGVGSHPRVRVGLEPSVASAVAAPLVEAMRSHAPDVQLVMEERAPEELLKLIETKGLDIALLYDVCEQRVVAQQALLTEALYLVGPRGGSAAPITFDEAARLPLIMPKRPDRIRERLEAHARTARIPVNIAMEIDSVSSIKKLAQAGLNHSVLSASECFEEHRLGLIGMRLIVDPSLMQTLSLCHLAGSQLSNSATRVRRLALQVIEDLVGGATWPGIVSGESHLHPCVMPRSARRAAS